MRTIGNILWFLLAGWWLALYYVLCGLLAFVLILLMAAVPLLLDLPLRRAPHSQAPRRALHGKGR